MAVRGAQYLHTSFTAAAALVLPIECLLRLLFHWEVSCRVAPHVLYHACQPTGCIWCQTQA